MALFGSFENTSLSEKITGRILTLIKEKHLKPGDKLPPERELAAMMQVSRPSLREALRALALLKVVEIRHGSGTYVSTLSSDKVLENLDLVMEVDESTFLDLFEARRVVEVGVIGLVAERISDDEIAELEAYHAECLNHRHNSAAFLSMDIDFHRMIARASGNPILIRFIDATARMNDGRRRRQELHSTQNLDQTIAEHEAIIAALKARDPQQATAAMLTHLINGRNRLLALLEN